MSKVSDMARQVGKTATSKMTELKDHPRTREMGNQVTQRLSSATKTIQEQIPNSTEISKMSKELEEKIKSNTEKTRDFTANKLKSLSENLRTELGSEKNNKEIQESGNLIEKPHSIERVHPPNIKSTIGVKTAVSIAPTNETKSIGATKQSYGLYGSASHLSSAGLNKVEEFLDKTNSQTNKNTSGEFSNKITSSTQKLSMTSYLASGRKMMPHKLKAYSPMGMLTERRKSYDSFKSKIALSRNVWITGAIAGIVAAMVGTVYTYEAILIQRREKELLNIEIEIKKIELDRLREVYKEEVLTRERAKFAQPDVTPIENRKSWLSFITG